MNLNDLKQQQKMKSKYNEHANLRTAHLVNFLQLRFRSILIHCSCLFCYQFVE